MAFFFSALPTDARGSLWSVHPKRKLPRTPGFLPPFRYQASKDDRPEEPKSRRDLGNVVYPGVCAGAKVCRGRVADAAAALWWGFRVESELCVGSRPYCQVIEDPNINDTHRILPIFGHECSLERSRGLMPPRGHREVREVGAVGRQWRGWLAAWGPAEATLEAGLWAW